MTVRKLIETTRPVVYSVEPTFVFVPIVNPPDIDPLKSKYFLICLYIINANGMRVTNLTNGINHFIYGINP